MDVYRILIQQKSVQSEMAFKSAINFVGKPIEFKLTDIFEREIPRQRLYVPHYRKNCDKCASRLICNGCSDCGKCE